MTRFRTLILAALCAVMLSACPAEKPIEPAINKAAVPAPPVEVTRVPVPRPEPVPMPQPSTRPPLVAAPAPEPAAEIRDTYTGPGVRYRALIVRESQFRFGIPAPAPVIAAQIQQESAWRPDARSPVGAQGLMQFMPATSRWVDTLTAFGTLDPFNPTWSIRAGVWYDRWIYERVKVFDTECDRWKFTLAGYNGGPGRINQRQRLSAAPGSWAATGYINPGILASNQRENQEYPERIIHRHQPQFAAWGRTVCV